MSNLLIAQQLKGISIYLKNEQIPVVARQYYDGKFRASDDPKTFSIIDSIETHNTGTRPFYLLLVSRMMANADGALAEILGLSCHRFFELNPDAVIDFLYSRHQLIADSYKDAWAKTIAGEIKISHENNEKHYLLILQKRVLHKGSMANRQKLTEFCRMVGNHL